MIKGGRSKWSKEHISAFQKIIEDLDDGKFFRLLNAPSFEQLRYPQLLAAYWQWCYNEFAKFSIPTGFYVTKKQIKDKWKK